MDYLSTLNPPQRQAVEHGDGPLLILAGAGSGKTRVLTCRIAHLVESSQARAEEILALTFTNKAAAEMRERVDVLLGESSQPGSSQPRSSQPGSSQPGSSQPGSNQPGSSQPGSSRGGAAHRVTVSTFHSLGARLLRRHSRAAGLSWGFCILDDDDQRRLIRQVAQELDWDDERRELNRLAGFIDEMKNAGRTPPQAHEVAFNHALEEDVHFYEAYQKALRKIDAVDFGDLILGPLELFRSDPNLTRRYSEAWRFLMVDEFQDTNIAQYELLRHLTSAHRNLAVVGDDDQAIYRWRGATVANILGFEKDFPKAKVIKLEQNYRSTQTILDAANDLIGHNQGRHDKVLWTDRAQGEKITVFTAQSDREEAMYVVEMINDLVGQGHSLDDFAIFYRTNAQARLFEEQLLHHGLPYAIIGGVSFFARKEIKDILAYLRVALQPDNDVALARVLNTPSRGIGNTTIERLQGAATVENIGSMYGALRLVGQREDRPEQAELFDPRGPRARSFEEAEAMAALEEIRGGSLKGIVEFLDLIDAVGDDLAHFDSLSTVVQQLIDRTYYFDHLERAEPELAEDKKRNVAELVNAIEEFERDPSLGVLLDEAREAFDEHSVEEGTQGGYPSRSALVLGLFLERSALVPRPETQAPATGSVTLMTVHGSKGLEFDAVFLVGMEEEIFPSLRDLGDGEELDEERRLGYVAITRAREQLFITNARRRRVYGKFRDTRPSRFLLEIAPDHLRIDGRSVSTTLDYASSGRGPRFPAPMEPGIDRRLWDFDQSPAMIKGQVQKAIIAHVRQQDQPNALDEFSQVDPRWEENPQWEGAAPESIAWQAPRDEPGAKESLEGLTLSHTRFGVGTILRASGHGDAALLIVDFPAHGEMTVIRKYVKILG